MIANSIRMTLVSLPMILASIAANAAVCPAIGASIGCSIIITRSASGVYSLAGTGVGPYDGGDDTLIGVVNNGPDALQSLTLSGANIFGFDGDGIIAYAGGGNYGTTGYEGPGTSFTVTNADKGVVHFTGGLASGASAYFGLEENLSGAVGAAPPIVISGTPEPGMWALMLVGFGSIGAVMRRRPTNVVCA